MCGRRVYRYDDLSLPPPPTYNLTGVVTEDKACCYDQMIEAFCVIFFLWLNGIHDPAGLVYSHRSGLSKVNRCQYWAEQWMESFNKFIYIYKV